MLVDATVEQGILQRLIYCLGAGIVILLILFSGLPLVVKTILTVLFLLLNVWWYKTFVALQAITEIWQQDNVTWGWRSIASSKYKTAVLKQTHYLGIVIVLNFQYRATHYNVLIWRDQVNLTEWRKLLVLTRLKQSQQNLF